MEKVPNQADCWSWHGPVLDIHVLEGPHHVRCWGADGWPVGNSLNKMGHFSSNSSEFTNRMMEECRSICILFL